MSTRELSTWKTLGLGISATLLFIGHARAQDANSGSAAPASASAASSAPESWESTIKLSAQFEAGIAGNPAGPSNGLNFGQLYTDKANQFELNQILLTAERDIDPSTTGFAWGFKFQLLYGSDGRYTQLLGEMNHAFASRYQLAFPEADFSFHLPILTSGGVDLKVGQYPSPVGYETIDPKNNPFYTHSYIYNFGVPTEETGSYAVLHVSPLLDIYGGADTGENTTFGGGDPNDAAAGLAGFALNNMLGGKLTMLALSHFGPENPTRTVPNANSKFRYENDVVVTYKASDKLSFTTELNYIRDDAFQADGYGAAQYASYALNDQFTLNGRIEVWRDNKGFFVAGFPGNHSFVFSELGLPTTTIAAAPTTYSEFTVGVTYKPGLPGPIQTLMLRPEIRYDRSLNGTTPFNDGRDSGAVTLAADAIIGF
jgi:Putative beta-barrel porin-2, OmpL-like. bbp2